MNTIHTHRWKVILPGQTKPTVVAAATATGALKAALLASPGYTYQGHTIGPVGTREIYNLLFEDGKAKVQKVKVSPLSALGG